MTAPGEFVRLLFDEVLTLVNTSASKVDARSYEKSGRTPVVDQSKSRIAGYTNEPVTPLLAGKSGMIVFGDHTCVTKFVDFPFVVGADGTKVLRARRPDRVLARYVAYLLELFPVASTGYNRHFSTLRQRAFDLPDVAVQRRFVNLLSDADALVASLESLMDKKREIKQGLMQELLTGRSRLPGFAGEWQTRSIGDFARAKAGGTPSTAVPSYWGGSVRWMSSGEIHRKRIREVDGRITDDGLRESPAQLFPAGTVLMALAGQGRTRGTVAVSEVDLATNQSIAGILPSGTHDPEFLYYNLDTRYDELRGESAGDGGRGGLNLTIIKKLDVLMPEIDEQRAVSSVLRDVDAEIETLSRRLSSAINVKQGMMQELLTGRTGLASEVAA